MEQLLSRLLPKVQKPARYTGGEYNQIVKNRADVDVRVAFCFPDTYEIGMSNLGMSILYGVMNNMPGVWCERVFAPWGDMEELMRQNSLPLWALESHDPVKDFDMIAFSIGYEMSYTNVLNMLDLAGIPLHSADRPGLEHIVFAGGTCTYNPEPLADFIDFCSLGEGEELTVEIVSLYQKAKKEGWTKEAFLWELSKIEGIYVPAFYTFSYNSDGTIAAITPRPGAPAQVVKRVVLDLDHAYYPVHGIVPSTEIVHDRTNIEVFRGCIRGCRFCQAGFCYRPIRSKSVDTLVRQATESLKDSGYQEATLSSLSTSDYRNLGEFADRMLDYCTPRGINLSLPSLRADNFSVEIMQKVQKVRKSGLTFAPEAGTQRLRDVINKNVTEEDVLRTCALAFSGGWNTVKLYFMLGLPTETDEDVIGIAELADKVFNVWKEHASNKKRGVTITLSTAFFVPKPNTPFQWEAQIDHDEYQRRCRLLKDHIRNRSIVYNWHDSQISYLEAVLARGDRRLCRVLEDVVRHGARLDAWNEYFSMDRWLESFRRCGADMDFYACRQRGKDEIFPWQTISIGLRRDFFWHERELAYQGRTTPDCRGQCQACGAARLMKGGVCDA